MANRFIKHAIAQVKYGRPPGQDEGMPEEYARVPAKVTSKMLARAQYEKELKELGSEVEDDLEVIDDVQESSASPAPSSSKGKGKDLAEDLLADVAQTVTGQKRRRRAVDAFAGTCNNVYQIDHSLKSSIQTTASRKQKTTSRSPGHLQKM